MSVRHARMNSRRWDRVRRFVFERDSYRCVTCGRASRLECDHIKPMQHEPKQNPYDPNGLQSICRSCHIEKTRRENLRPLTPQEKSWVALIREMF